MKQYKINFSDTPRGTHLAVLMGLIYGQIEITGRFTVYYKDKLHGILEFNKASRREVIDKFKGLVEEITRWWI